MRLKRLEAVWPDASLDDFLDRLTDLDWLTLFEQWEREGAFDGEPDFPVALDADRDALEQAAALTDPPFDPPADFMPALADRPHLRLINWNVYRSTIPNIAFPSRPVYTNPRSAGSRLRLR